MTSVQEEQDACQHNYKITGESDTTGLNLLGQEVHCYGFNEVCRLCGSTTWMRNNEKTKQEDDEFTMSHFI